MYVTLPNICGESIYGSEPVASMSQLGPILALCQGHPLGNIQDVLRHYYYKMNQILTSARQDILSTNEVHESFDNIGLIMDIYAFMEFTVI